MFQSTSTPASDDGSPQFINIRMLATNDNSSVFHEVPPTVSIEPRLYAILAMMKGNIKNASAVSV